MFDFALASPSREHEHPEVARVHQEVDLIVENAVADADAHAQVVGRQIAEFRKDQPRHDIEGVDRHLEKGIEGQPRCRGKQFADRAVEAQALDWRG